MVQSNHLMFFVMGVGAVLVFHVVYVAGSRSWVEVMDLFLTSFANSS